MKEIKLVISEALGIKEEDVTDELKYQEIDAWDSLSHLNLVAKLEEEYKIELDMDEITSMSDVKKIKEILSKHNVEI